MFFCSFSSFTLCLLLSLSLSLTFSLSPPPPPPPLSLFLSLPPSALPTSGVLQSGVVITYTTYLTWSSVSDSPSACSDVGGSSTATVVLGAILTFLAVGYSALRTSSASQMGKLGMSQSDDSKAVLLDDNEGGEDDGDEEQGGQRVVDNEKHGVLYSWTFFHLVFALASLYIMMVLTDWAVIR